MKNRVMQWLIVACLILTLLPILPITAAEGDVLTTNKTTYEAGEPILVTAIGSGADWVGLYLEEDEPGVQASIWWYYVDKEGVASGDEVDIRQAPFSNPDRAWLSDVPAGAYKVMLLANDGYEVLAEIHITVEASETELVTTEAPTEPVTTEPVTTEPVTTEPVTTEAPTEPVTTAPETQPDTTSVTEADTTVAVEDTTQEATDAATTAPETASSDTGSCASALTGMSSVIALVSAAGGAWFLRRRRH